jgi:hypothetical protein
MSLSVALLQMFSQSHLRPCSKDGSPNWVVPETIMDLVYRRTKKIQKCVIGEGCQIHETAKLTNCIILRNVIIMENAVLEASLLISTTILHAYPLFFLP